MIRLCARSITKIVKLLVCLVALYGVGCSKSEQPNNELNKLPTHVDGASDRAIVALQARLNKAGVNIITQGQEYMVSIPSSLLFATQSPHLTWESYQLLNDVACYLQQFRKITVNVTAFSSKYVSVKREHALTLARAQAVGDYLWSQGIDGRFIFTQGAGSDKPVLATKTRSDLSPNSRIEITFRRAIA